MLAAVCLVIDNIMVDMMHRPFLDIAVVTNMMCGKSPPTDFTVLTEEYRCKKNQCTWVALGSKTTLIGFGEVTLTKGTRLWQPDSQKHESLKAYAVILDHYQDPPLLTFVDIQSQELWVCVTRQKMFSVDKKTVTISGPIHSVLQEMGVIIHILHLSSRKAMDAPLLTIATWSQHMGWRPLGVMGGADSLSTIGSLVTSSWEAALSSHQQISL